MNKVARTGDVADDIRRIITSINQSEAVLAFSACGTEVTDGGGGGGGAGTVTSVAGGVGITNTPEPITGVGTVDLDVNSLTTETVLATGDLLPFLDVSVGVTPASQRKITVANLLAGLQTLGGLVDGSGVAGQVAFWSDPNTLTGENALFWDATNDRLGIGTSSPGTQLHLQRDGSATTFRTTTYDNSLNPQWATERARGSVALPTGVLAGTALSQWLFRGQFSTTPGDFANGAGLTLEATEVWSSIARGTHWRWFNVVAGTTTFAELMRFADDNSVLIGTTVKAGGKLVVAGHVSLNSAGAASELRLYEPTGGAEYSSFKSPALVATLNYTLPPTLLAGSVLTDVAGNGTLTWAVPAGGGTVTGTGAAGQVATWTSASAITGENALFWDATNNRLGINTITPTNPLEIVGESTSAAIVSTRYDAAAASSGSLTARRARGTLAIPATLAALDSVGKIIFQGHDATSFTTQGQLEVLATEAWTLAPPAKGTRLVFSTTPNGSATLTERVSIDHNGNVGIGTGITPATLLDIDGDFASRKADVVLINGANHNVAIGTRSIIRITGPTAAFSVSGFTNGVDGKRLTLHNTTTFPMTIANDATSTAANRILTNVGANVTLGTSLSAAEFYYDSTQSRWILLGQLGALQPLDADLTQIAAVVNLAGDLLVTDSGGTWVRLGIGAPNTVLRSDGIDPAWGAIALADLPALTSAQWATKITDESGGPGGGIVFGDNPILTNATLATPIIGNFTNALHTHQNVTGGGQLDHGLAMVAASLLDDDHTGYTRLVGRAGVTNDTTLSTTVSGTLYGSNQPSTVAAPRDLNLDGTSNAAKGQINLNAPAVTRSVTRTGTGTVQSSATILTGTGTAFQDELSAGDTITAAGFDRHVASISSQTVLILDRAFPQDILVGVAFTYQRAIHKFLNGAGVTRGLLSADDYFVLGATSITATNQANLSVTGTQPPSVSSGPASEAPRAFFVQGAKGGNSTATDGSGAGNGGRFNLVAGAGGDASGTNGLSGTGGAWTASGGAGGTLSAAGGGTTGAGGPISFSAGIGGPLTGAASGSIAGPGGAVTFTAGNGGTAIAGNTRGNGGVLTLRPGLAGTGAGTGGINGFVKIADVGGNCVIGSVVDNGERLGVAGDFAMRAADVALANGNNDNIAIGSRSFVRITGPTAAFVIRGIANGSDGKLLVIENTVNFTMSFNNDDAGSTAANRIYLGSGAGPLVLAAGAGATDKARAVFIYDATLTRWILLSARDAAGPR